jgi:transcriptional regulator with XRE-family HTH domain
MTLGKRIKAARSRLRPKLTQQALADKLGISDKAVSGWERDANLPDSNKLSDLRTILKVTYVWLIDGGNTAPPAVDDAEVLLEERAAKLYRRERDAAA